MKVSLFWLIIISIIWMVAVQKKEKEVFIVEPLDPKAYVQKKKIVKNKSNIKRNTFKIIIERAKENLGKPYLLGTKGPETFDCSGFLYTLHKEVDISLPRTALGQSEIEGNKISRNLLKKGDLIFFDTAEEGKVNHSAIYLGDGTFIHASSGKAYSVTISSLDGWYKDKFKWGKRLNANK